MPEKQGINIGNKQVFRKLFDDFYLPLCLFTERYVGDPELANDLVQECFIKLWQRRTDFQYLYQVKSFLYTSLRNAAVNELEHRKIVSRYAERLQSEGEESFFRDHVVEEETYRMLITAIEKLPVQTRNVMYLALEGHDNKKIATQLEISDGTVHTLKKIAYKRLRNHLKEYFYLIVFFFSY